MTRSEFNGPEEGDEVTRSPLAHGRDLVVGSSGTLRATPRTGPCENTTPLARYRGVRATVNACDRLAKVNAAGTFSKLYCRPGQSDFERGSRR